MVGYQWDGFKIFSHAKKCVKHFGRFYVFAPEDVDYAKNRTPITNFYFDYLPERTKITSGKSIYFFGTYIIYRMEMIALFTETIKKLGYEPNINILASRYDNTEKYKNTDIQFLTQGISFKENIQNAKDADILVHFVNGKHSGLSFRTFDAIGYDKKLITTNADIKKYDFYNSNNFFILHQNNLHELEDFLNRPYVMPEKHINEKYSFTNWLHCVLDIEPYQKIELPKV